MLTRLRLTSVAIFLLTMTVLAERTQLKPATNVSPQEDIKLGLEVSKDAEKQLVLINNPEATAYISSLGNTLVAKAPNVNKFPFTFKIVNDRSINAFALPGGPVYVNRGAIEAADNEAQIAGVIGHESGHVILRHGMSEAQKAQRIQTPLAILQGILGDSIASKVASGLGGFAANSVLLKNSRDAEAQADLMGTQILYDNGYDPTAMATFFDKLAKEHKGTKTEQFFSNHPIPENRIAKVNEEIQRLGPVPANPKMDSAAFQHVKQIMLAMPEPPKAPAANATSAAATPVPQVPSTRLMDFQTSGFQLRHPDNWKSSVQGTNVTLAPAGGVVGKGDLAYGMIMDVYKPQATGNLDQTTTRFISSIQMGNPSMKIVRSRVQGSLGGKPAQLTELSNTSPVGGQESDVIITVLRSDGTLQYFIQVAPVKDLPQYQTSFKAILDSVRFR